MKVLIDDTAIDTTEYVTTNYEVLRFPIKLQMSKLAKDDLSDTPLNDTFIDHLMSLPFSLAAYGTASIFIPSLNRVLNFNIADRSNSIGNIALVIENPDDTPQWAYPKY